MSHIYNQSNAYIHMVFAVAINIIIQLLLIALAI